MLAANVTKLGNDSFILLSAAAETGDRVDGATKSTLQPQKRVKLYELSDTMIMS